MVRLLAVDAAGAVAAAAFEDGVAIATAENGDGRADRLPERIRACLVQADWRPDDVQLLACNVGPGGFTAVRTGVAATKAFALATGCPVLAVGSLDAIAEQARQRFPDRSLRVVLRAGQGGWFVFDVDAGGQGSGPRLEAGLPAAPEGGLLVGPEQPAGQDIRADALDVGRLALRLLRSGAVPIEGKALLPVYLRDADARPGAGRSLLDTMAGAA